MRVSEPTRPRPQPKHHLPHPLPILLLLVIPLLACQWYGQRAPRAAYHLLLLLVIPLLACQGWPSPTAVPPSLSLSPAPPSSPPPSPSPAPPFFPSPSPSSARSSPPPSPSPASTSSPSSPLTLPSPPSPSHPVTASPRYPVTASPRHPATQSPIAVWEGAITLNTYGWEEALIPTNPNDPIYPYPRLDFDAVGPPVLRSHRAVFIQNEYVQLVVAPDLGGRILRWTDRTTGRQLFYANPVVKPTHWGYRGWWLATGGIEWAFPVEEHGLNEYRPWDYEILWNGIRVWDTDDRTGLRVEVSIQVDPGTARVQITPRISNPTGDTQVFQFWANGMLTLSDFNAPSSSLSFVLPASEVIVHSSGDGGLPGPGGRMAWPVHNGRDFSRYAEWRSWLGVFAPQAADAGFAGAYDLEADQGIVRVAPAWVRGVKLFCTGDLGAEHWTDDGSRYFEFWGGLTSSFWEYTSLEPGESVAWTEVWHAVSGIGGLTWANREGAVRLTPTDGGVEVAVETVRPTHATVILYRQGEDVARWPADIGPGRPLRIFWEGEGGPWGVDVLDAEGDRLIQADH